MSHRGKRGSQAAWPTKIRPELPRNGLRKRAHSEASHSLDDQDVHEKLQNTTKKSGYVRTLLRNAEHSQDIGFVEW